MLQWQVTNQTARRFARRFIQLLLIIALALPGVLWSGQPLRAATLAAASKMAIVGGHGAALVATPGGPTLGALQPGTPVQVTARSADSQWLAVQTVEATPQLGWLTTADLVVFGVASLPVVNVEVIAEPPAPPIAVAAVTAQPEPTATLTVTNTPTPTVLTAQPTIPAPVATATPTHDAFMAEVTSAGLNVRTGPGVQFPVLAEVRRGEQFAVLARTAQGDWVQIALDAERVGWVAAGFVRLNGPVASAPLAANTPASEQPQEGAGAAVSEPITASAQPTAGLTGKLVFSSGNGGLFYVYEFATGAVRALTNGYDPAFSPDGRQIAFTRVGGEGGLYVINSDGNDERKIFAERAQLSSPKWSPDGQWVVFSQLESEYKCRLLGNRDTCVSVDELLSGLPDGLPEAQYDAIKDNILSQFPEEVRPNWTLARVNNAGSDYRDLAALNSALAADWNEAGIVYQSKAGIERTADAPDATTQSIIAAHYLHDPDWQPGGGQIVYQRRRGSHWEIFSVNPDGSANRALTQPRTTLVDQLPSNVAAAWSPDGQHIVFLSNREENGEAGVWRIWVMNEDGGNQRSLPIETPIQYNFTQEQMVSWSQ